MRAWVTIHDVVRDLELNVSEANPPAVLAELRRRVRTAHPDRTGGDFSSPESRDHFLKLQSAIDFVEHQVTSSTALVPLDQVTGLIKVMAGHAAEVQRREDRKTTIIDVRESAKTALFLPKVTSGIFLAVTSALFLLQTQFREHPLFGKLVTDDVGIAFLGLLWFLSGVLFVVFWAREKSVEAAGEFLTSDEGIEEVFHHLRSYLVQTGETQFSTRDVVEAIFASLRHRRGAVNRSAARRIADNVITTLVERGAVQRVNEPGVTVTFEINGALQQRRPRGA